MFLLLFLVGFFGFVAMVALGAHHGSGGHHGHGGGLLHGHGHILGSGHGHVSHGAGAAIHAHGSHTSHLQHVDAAQGSNTGGSNLLLALSPIDIFAVSLGIGATGLLLPPAIGGSAVTAIAILGGLVFDFGMVKPLMRYLFRFASVPSEGLEGSVAQEAEAMTGFDRLGRGLVRLTLDGQHVQLLATLDSVEQDKGVRVRKGERVLVVDVDPTRNTCRVTRELAS